MIKLSNLMKKKSVFGCLSPETKKRNLPLRILVIIYCYCEIDVCKHYMQLSLKLIPL